MKKIILIALVCLNSLLAKDLEDIYLEEGINAVRNAIEANLQDKNYWNKKLGSQDLKYGYYYAPTFVSVVDKTAKTMELLSYKDGNLSSVANYDVITGLMGEKLKEGDLKTPVGAYQITRKFTPQDDYYGPVAFSLSYPNLYDKARSRDGGGIWIHGHPRAGGDRIDSSKTKGCVVLQNNFLNEFTDKIGDKGGIVLINEKGKANATNMQIASLLAELFRWKTAWGNSDATTYLSFYDPEFRRFDGMKLAEYSKMKKSIFSRKENKYIQFTNFSIIPYPNTEKGNFFRISFYEKYLTQTYKFNGEKTLYVRLDGDKMKILMEE